MKVLKQQNFLVKILQKFIANIFTLLLTHFASKLVNYSLRSDSLQIYSFSFKLMLVHKKWVDL